VWQLLVDSFDFEEGCYGRLVRLRLSVDLAITFFVEGSFV
jgi:hypothetical protein